MDTDKSARRSMMKFVACIFGLGVILAGIYFFVLTPGTPDKETIADPQKGLNGQQSR